MTLILTHVTPDYVMQVTDRLVSQGSRSYDPESNKNVIFFTRNALVSIGYSGLSYLSGIPTDQWIVETLIGEKLPGRGSPMIGDSTRRRLPSIGQAVQLLADRLSTEWAKVRPEWRGHRIQLAISGWLGYRRKRPRPIFCKISPSGATSHSVKWHTHHSFGTELLDDTPEGYLRRQEGQELVTSLGTSEMPDVEAALIRTIRMVAARNPRVGPDCMAITISPPRFQNVIVNYVPVQPRKAVTRTLRGQEVEIPVAGTPFMVSPGGIWAPNVMSAHSTPTTRSFGGWIVRFPGATQPNDGPIAMALWGQERKPPPR